MKVPLAVISTTWVGVWIPTMEPVPLIFCVEVLFADHRRDRLTWHVTEDEALAWHQRQLELLEDNG